MWREDVDAGDEAVVLTGPVGDHLSIYAEPDPFNPPEEVDWTLFTWTGGVSTTLGGAQDETFTVTDASTSTVLDVLFVMDTSTWEAGVDRYGVIRGTDGTTDVTILEAILRPTEPFTA